MATVFVVPLEGQLVPNPDLGAGIYFAAGGETVELTPYVQRRIDDGDLIESEPAGPHWSDIVIGDLDTLSYDIVTIKSGSGALEAGMVLGQITADSKWEPSPATGATGSETAAAILTVAVDATAADVEARALTNFAEVNTLPLSYAASVNDAPKKAAKALQLRAAGIKVRA